MSAAVLISRYSSFSKNTGLNFILPAMVVDKPQNKPMVLYFDTEQGKFDSHNVIKRIETMVGGLGDFKAFRLRRYTPQERCELIEYAFEQYGDVCCLAVIDGIADLATAINDEDEATRVSSILLRLTADYQCHIVTVLHQNKNDNFATGHLGSMVMKKAELIVSVTRCREDKDSSIVESDYSRGIDFDSFMMTINWDGIPEMGEGIQFTKKEKKTFNGKEEENPF